MTRAPALAALIFIAGCTQQAEQTPAAEETAHQVAEAAVPTEVPALEGNWQVAAIDGKPVSAGSALTASFAGGKVSIASGCVRRGLTYTQNRNVVSFTDDPGGSANCEGGGTSAEHETAYAALQGATIAIFGKDGSEANLSGTGGNLTLKRR